MNRRQIIAALGGAAVLPTAARAQQAGLPVVGFLHPGSLAYLEHFVAAFLEGLRETGYVEGTNVTVEYRWAQGRSEQLARFAEDLAGRRVQVIATAGPPATFAAKAVTSSIPIVFIGNDDPVKEGLVASINRPGGNLTGVAVFNAAEMWSKRLELLRNLIPKASSAAMLVNPTDVSNPELSEMTPAARALGLQLSFLPVSTDAELEAAFATAVERRIAALLVSERPFFTVRYTQIPKLAARHAMPMIYGWREYVMAGGLMSYGSSLTDAWHQVGLYVGRILKGAKPADLPVVLPTRLELVINPKTAKALGIDVPPTLLAIADEVIE